MEPRLVVLDIDGTVTRSSGGLDGDLLDTIRTLSQPVLFATGKAFPYPIALCHYLAIPERVVAENGGVVCVDDHLEITADTDRLDGIRQALSDAEIPLGWGRADLVNRWRESELAVNRSTVSRASLAAVADEYGFEVVDSGYAYHVKDPAISKGDSIERACSMLDVDPSHALAIGDSENDVSMFEVVGTSVAVANADAPAKRAADVVLDVGYAEGTQRVLEGLLE